MSQASVVSRRNLTLAAGTIAAQVIVYLLLIVLSRELGTSDYGELASVFTLVAIGAIPGLAYQLWVARYVARIRRTDPGAALPATLVHFTARLALACTVLTGLMVVVLSPVLHTSRVPALVGVVLAVPAMVVIPAVQGLLQGQDRIARLAAMFVITALGRLVGGLAALAIHHGALSALVGQGAGLCVAAAVGCLLVDLPRSPARRGPTWWSVSRIVGAAGSIWVLSNIDIVLARSVLPHHAAGLYSVGALITRAVQFAPQFLVVSTFTRFTDPATARRALVRASRQLLGIGGLAVVGAAVLGPLVIPVVFGHGYDQLGHVAWAFAALGTVLALNQLLLSQRIAGHDESASALVWAAAVVFAVGAFVLPGLSWVGLVGLAGGVNVVLAAGLAFRVRRRDPRVAVPVAPGPERLRRDS